MPFIRRSVPNTQSHRQKHGDAERSTSPFSPYRDDISHDESKLRAGTNWDNYSVASHELFEEGKDDIIFEGEVMKFKPGISINFIPRYVQISRRAFRYFKNKSESYSTRPIVSIRKRIIKQANPYVVNRKSYLKPGSAVTKSHKEDEYFDHMFEVVLN